MVMVNMKVLSNRHWSALDMARLQAAFIHLEVTECESGPECIGRRGCPGSLRWAETTHAVQTSGPKWIMMQDRYVNSVRTGLRQLY